MLIKNPTIKDIRVRDYITFKSSVDKVHEAYKKNKFHSIRTCEEIVDYGWNKIRYTYEVREVHPETNTIVVYGWTKTPNPCYNDSVGSWSFQGQKFTHEVLSISPEDIDTLYSQKTHDPYLNKVFENMVEAFSKSEYKLSEFLTDKYDEIAVGRYDTEFDPCNLHDYICNGSENSSISGLCYLLNSFREGFFRWNENNELVWNAEKLNTEDITDEVKRILEDIVSGATKEYRIISKDIETDELLLGQDWWKSKTTITLEDRKAILEAVKKFYEWMMSFITPLVDTNINDAHNAEIDKLVEEAEQELKSCESQINSMFNKMEEIQKKIGNLKTQYK